MECHMKRPPTQSVLEGLQVSHTTTPESCAAQNMDDAIIGMRDFLADARLQNHASRSLIQSMKAHVQEVLQQVHAEVKKNCMAC